MKIIKINNFSKSSFLSRYIITGILVSFGFGYYLISGLFFNFWSRITNRYSYTSILDYFSLILENILDFLFIFLLLLNIKHILGLIFHYGIKNKYKASLKSIFILNLYVAFSFSMLLFSILFIEANYLLNLHNTVVFIVLVVIVVLVSAFTRYTWRTRYLLTYHYLFDFTKKINYEKE